MGNSSEKLPVAIIGGGVTGLAAAHRLVRQGISFRLFEATPRLGGNIRTERDGDWLVEAGPNSLQLTPQLASLLAELGLSPAHASPAAKNRYIVRDGRPVAAPASPASFLTSPLFSGLTKLQLLIEVFSRRRVRASDISLADLMTDHFGAELVDYGLRPFVSGVYAGDAQKLSARHSFPAIWEAERTHGSLIRAQIAAAKARRARGESAAPPPAVSFDDGLETFTRALAAALPPGSVELNTPVSSLVPGPTWKVNGREFSSVILALPAAALANLSFGPESTPSVRPLEELARVEYPPVSSLFLGYKRAQIAHPLDGFGMLVPPAEHRPVLGVIFNSTLFPSRAPEGHVALTVMTGGAIRPDLARLEDSALLAVVGKQLSELLGVSGAPVFVRRKFWPRAIPQYNLGYDRFLDLVTKTETANPGLLIGGHIRDGISIPSCVAAGEFLAARVASRE